MRQNYHSMDRSALGGCLRQIFNAAFWKQVRQRWPARQERWRATYLGYVWIGTALSGCHGLRERFEDARGWTARTFPKRRRPGVSYQGFADASAQHGLALLQTLRARTQQYARGNQSLAKLRWPAFSLDGSRLRVPHTRANENAFGLTRIKNRVDSAPQVLVVAAVEMSQRVLWDWEVTGGNGSEPELAERLIPRLPNPALVVKDAGAVSYAWLAGLLAGGRHILMRVAGNFRLWCERVGATRQQGGIVWLHDRLQQHAPLRLRLITVPLKKRGRRRSVIYLLTDILDSAQLSKSAAASLYYERWSSSEIGFRGLKQTLRKTVLLARTPEMAMLECQYSLLGMQLLGVVCNNYKKAEARWSLAQMWRAWREMTAGTPSAAQLQRSFEACVLDAYCRHRPKSRRRAPHKKPLDQLGPPNLRKLTHRVKQDWSTHFGWTPAPAN